MCQRQLLAPSVIVAAGRWLHLTGLAMSVLLTLGLGRTAVELLAVKSNRKVIILYNNNKEVAERAGYLRQSCSPRDRSLGLKIRRERVVEDGTRPRPHL